MDEKSALMIISYSDAVGVLIDFLDNPSEKVRLEAIRKISSNANEIQQNTMVDLAESKYEDVRNFANLALR